MNEEIKDVRERYVKGFLDVIIASILMDKASWGYDIIADIHEKLHTPKPRNRISGFV